MKIAYTPVDDSTRAVKLAYLSSSSRTAALDMLSAARLRPLRGNTYDIALVQGFAFQLLRLLLRSLVGGKRFDSLHDHVILLAM